MSEFNYELYDALRAVNIPEDKAKAAVQAIKMAVDKRYKIHEEQLASKGSLVTIDSVKSVMRRDLADAKLEIFKWSVVSIFVAVSLAAFIVKIIG
ncbi:hypothetical protein ACKF11_12870 [Methylobacillus sp. Pita2]|uniref:hypothetical protein n=1 Tax=Methylobacillus sp. Pita2 TaxID=3383245 RepID=UPI0038B4C427